MLLFDHKALCVSIYISIYLYICITRLKKSVVSKLVLVEDVVRAKQEFGGFAVPLL